MISKCLDQIIILVEKKIGAKRDVIVSFNWQAAVQQRMEKFKIVNEERYLHVLQTDSDELQKLIELIVVPETWFFRNQAAFDLLPILAVNNNLQNHFHILSLACSSGEECYSIIMALFTSGFPLSNLTVDGVDINKTCLAQATTGRYGKNSFRGSHLNYRKRFFDKIDLEYVIHEDLRKPAHFYYGNVTESFLPFHTYRYDVVFCRNLLIYLNDITRVRVLEQIKDILTPQGILVVGAVETQIALSAGFASFGHPHAYAFTLKQSAVANIQTVDITKKIIPITNINYQKLPAGTPPLPFSPITLLDRVPSQDYIQEWTDFLMKRNVVAEGEKKMFSVVVFRLGMEWFALKTFIFQEITHKRAIHSIPHRQNSILRGIVNLNGELQLCIALDKLLEVAMVPPEPTQSKSNDHARMIAVGQQGQLWVFAVDEIDGIYHCESSTIENVPVTLSKSPVNYLIGIVAIKKRSVGLLDEELLFHTLKRNV